MMENFSSHLHVILDHLSLTSWILPLEEGGARLSSGDLCRENLDSFFNQTQSWPLIFPIRGSESSSCLLWLWGRDSLTLDPFSTSFDVTQEQDRCHSPFPTLISLWNGKYTRSFQYILRCHSGARSVPFTFSDFDSSDGMEIYSILSVHPSMSLRRKIGAIHLFRL